MFLECQNFLNKTVSSIILCSFSFTLFSLIFFIILKLFHILWPLCQQYGYEKYLRFLFSSYSMFLIYWSLNVNQSEHGNKKQYFNENPLKDWLQQFRHTLLHLLLLQGINKQYKLNESSNSGWSCLYSLCTNVFGKDMNSPFPLDIDIFS